ncbi:hypothetical protein L9F63_017844 [Diploptera punctata]|uniref:Ionotropic glutamate receptor C-terminal domain-containing protein n=1 Tax=Diploptera punctata TaxID=6984 RepID=A0AAD7ZYQ3_DIPPU|nr:hypothetical protein L9F63_017844 [Diploptera punctata]
MCCQVLYLSLLLCFSATSAKVYDNTISIVKQYYEHNGISLVTAFVCWGVYEQYLVRAFESSGIRINFVRDPDVLVDILENDIYYRIGIVVDLACRDSQEALLKASFKKQFDIHKYWILLEDGRFSRNEQVRNESSTYEVVYSVDNNIFPEGVLNDEDIFNISYKISEFGIATLSALRILEDSEILYPDEFTSWEDLSLRHVDKWSKIHWPIYGYLSEQMNFTFEVSYQLDNYGWLINGSFDGMMGYMQREEVEFPSTGIFVRKDRFAVTSFAADTFPLRATTMFRQPSLSTVSNIFTLPFNSSVWICCLALCMITIATLEIQIILTVREHIERDMVHSKLSDIFTFVLGAICQQGFHITPSSLAGRTTVFILTLSALFLFTSYSANIVALLQTSSSSFKTIRDLTFSPMIVGVENQTYNRVYMKETTDPELREFYLKKIAPQGEKIYYHPAIGMAKIKTRMHAFQVDTTAAYKIMSETYEEYEKCGLQEIDLFPAPMFTIAVTKGSPLRDYFSQRVRWYREVGLLDRLFKIWMPQKAKCESNAGGFVSVSLVEFYPAMLVLQYGTMVAIGILIIEKFYFYRLEIASRILLFLPHQKLGRTKKRPFIDKDTRIIKHKLVK